MGSVLKSFLIIFFVSLGIGVSYVIALTSPILGSVMFGLFCIFDVVVILEMLCSSRTCIFGLSTLFVPLFFVVLISFSMWQYYGIWVKSCLLAWECSLSIAVLGLLVWGIVFLFEKIKKLYLGKV
jgi:hypothetical protein